ncbi:polysaccharide deacetylase family protein [Pontibacter sp. 13R65]|uniref:polysaccharide deacetylase family protein n=1 Tax=Pontibacter sp. 13R65 TaxID=3127458 RepID=UPI00301BD778
MAIIKFQKKTVAVFLLLTTIIIACCFYVFHQYLRVDFSYHKTADQASFVLSFDDQYVKQWYAHRDLFKKYGVHATFFITKPDLLSTEEIEMLHILAADGHEIASHGYRHVNAVAYTEEHSLGAYIEHEVLPAIKTMHAQGFAPVTFAYPYGASSRKLDRELLKYFLLVRGDSWKVEDKPVEKLDRIFYKFDGSRVINGLGIDMNSGVTLQDIEQGFNRATDKQEAINLYAHSIEIDSSHYGVTTEFLENILELAQGKNLKSITFKELAL